MRRAVGGALLALALTVPVPVAGASTTVPSGAAASGAATTDLPAGVSIDHVEWLDGGEDEQGRRVDLYVNSAAMPGEPLKVEMQLARDWYTRPEQTFASVWTLGGIYGSDESNSWLTQADAAEWYADKNVNLIMPVGGGATFYTDWVNQDNGETINWETFLTEELPAVLAKDFRSGDRRAIMGVSMGGDRVGHACRAAPGQVPVRGLVLRLPRHVLAGHAAGGGRDAEGLGSQHGGEHVGSARFTGLGRP